MSKHKTCKYCGSKLRVIYVQGGFCSFGCRVKYKNIINGRRNV